MVIVSTFIAVSAANRIALPPGSSWGQGKAISSLPSPKTISAGPPPAGIRIRPRAKPSLTRRLPSSPQCAPPTCCPETSPIVTTAPPSTAILFSLLPAAKATHCPSGEKNGTVAPCVPGSSVAVG